MSLGEQANQPGLLVEITAKPTLISTNTDRARVRVPVQWDYPRIRQLSIRTGFIFPANGLHRCSDTRSTHFAARAPISHASSDLIATDAHTTFNMASSESPASVPGDTDQDEKPRVFVDGPGGADTKQGAKIACLECRSAKIKCSAPTDGQVPCKRCVKHQRECLFEKHKRGRKPNKRFSVPSDLRAAARNGSEVNLFDASNRPTSSGGSASMIPASDPAKELRTVTISQIATGSQAAISDPPANPWERHHLTIPMTASILRQSSIRMEA
ncbi:hypothetical protein [Sporisorium scitamineum]|uniref:Zn(2)-C6 fungal-type domain-containing protein n=1 Tax=Sporisorium scitamineum TaxID=49012 RepID=A0A0F7RUR5_9BASI|nr:hypothetical protein [Sporisorium scitamineum]